MPDQPSLFHSKRKKPLDPMRPDRQSEAGPWPVLCNELPRKLAEYEAQGMLAWAMDVKAGGVYWIWIAPKSNFVTIEEMRRGMAANAGEQEPETAHQFDFQQGRSE